MARHTTGRGGRAPTLVAAGGGRADPVGAGHHRATLQAEFTTGNLIIGKQVALVSRAHGPCLAAAVTLSGRGRVGDGRERQTEPSRGGRRMQRVGRARAALVVTGEGFPSSFATVGCYSRPGGS